MNTKRRSSRQTASMPLLCVAIVAIATTAHASGDIVLAQAASTTPASAPVLPASPEQQNPSPLPPSASPSAASPSAAAPSAAAPSAAATSPTTNIAPAIFSKDWQSTVTPAAQIEGGFTFNPERPADGLNFGRSYDDRANLAVLDAIQLTLQRAINPAATNYDFGFTVQAIYGTDARYQHFLGELDRAFSDREQITVIQANIAAHLPWLTAGGIDVKAGQYVSPLGYETIDPSTNPFYSHSYLFNWGVPLAHTGILSTAHITPLLDIWLGIDSGSSTTLGAGDNNDEPAGIIGFGLNGLLGGKLTIIALSHLGPDDSIISDPNADKDMRYENDAIATYKQSDALSYVLELNYNHDNGGRADAYGAAAYLAYAMSPTVTLNTRFEVFRDNAGFFVAGYPHNLDAALSLAGQPSTAFGGGATTYSEGTIGLTWKPAVPKSVALLSIRPELRYDRSLNGTQPFDAGTNTGSFTAAVDAILGF